MSCTRVCRRLDIAVPCGEGHIKATRRKDTQCNVLSNLYPASFTRSYCSYYPKYSLAAGYYNIMRLLDTWTGQFVEKDPRDPETKYAILSHTWDSEGEQTYQELRVIQGRYASKDRHQQVPRVVESDPSPSAKPDHGSSSSTPPSSPHIDDALPSTPPDGQEKLSPGRSVLHAPLSTTTAVSSHPDTTRDHPDMRLSPLWDEPELSPKIRDACKIARENGYRYFWIDSCCIDKTSSSELSEAINSMYQWYSRAEVCFAFLADVPAEEDHEKEGSKFRKSRWFTRGWTLQELIAPVNVRFLSAKWTFIGSKHSLAGLVSEITGIAYNALLRVEPLDMFSVAQRLSWAATRETTRVEDRAYSLLGLFDINMPTLYGEGHRAFRRLQEEIMRRIPDQSLFAWTSFSLDSPTDHHEPGSAIFQHVWYSRDIPELDHPSLFAPSLDLFRHCGGIEPLPGDEAVRRLQHHLDLPAADYYSTPYGIRTRFPVIPFSVYFPTERITDLRWGDRTRFIPLSQWYLAVLECEHKDYPGHLLARVCYTQASSFPVEFSFCGYVEIGLPRTPSDANRKFDILPLSPITVKRLHSPQIQFSTVYIPHGQERDGGFDVCLRTPHDTIKLVVLKKTRDDLQAKGYTVDLHGPDPDHPTTHQLILSHATHDITIEFRHTLKGYSDDQKLTVRTWITVSGKGWGGSSQTDSLPWSPKLFGTGGTGGDIPGAGQWSIWESLNLAAKDHYAVHVELRPGTFTPPTSRWWKRTCAGRLRRLATRMGRAVSTFLSRDRREARSHRPGELYSELAEDA